MDEYKWLTVTNADNKKLTRFIHPKICVDSEGKLVQNQWVEPQIKYLCESKNVDLIDKLENDDEKRTGYPIHPYLLVDELLKEEEITVLRNDQSRKLGFFDFSDNRLSDAQQAPEGFIKDEGAVAGADAEEEEEVRPRPRRRRTQPRITEENKEALEQLISDNHIDDFFRWHGSILQFLILDTSQLEFIGELLRQHRWSLQDTGKTERLSGASSAAGSLVHIYNINKLPDEELPDEELQLQENIRYIQQIEFWNGIGLEDPRDMGAIVGDDLQFGDDAGRMWSLDIDGEKIIWKLV